MYRTSGKINTRVRVRERAVVRRQNGEENDEDDFGASQSTSPPRHARSVNRISIIVGASILQQYLKGKGKLSNGVVGSYGSNKESGR